MGDVSTRGYLPIVYYLCRDRQGLKSSGYKQFYRTYFNICGHSAEALLIAGIRQRFIH
jgi:hypothetical protein